MTTRTVTVHLKAKVGDYLAGMKMSEKAAKDLRGSVDQLNKAGAGMSRGGIITALAGVPGMASAAVAGLSAVPAVALSGAAAISTLMVATNGLGDAMGAVAEGDAKKLGAALSELSGNARTFVLEYQRIRPTLAAVADSTQDALFAQMLGQLDKLTGTYLPLLQRQAPRLAGELGKGGAALASWATAPNTVAKVNRQYDLAVDVTTDLNRLLRAGLGLVLDLADAGRDFTAGTVGGLADGAEALERWVSYSRSTGQMNQIFENGARILERLGEVTSEVGELLADVADNPALVDGAETLFDVLGIGLDIVHALLQVFELLPAGVQSTIVTLAVLGGTALAVTGRVIALKASLDQLKLSAIQAGGAVKTVGGFLGGPWGIALTVATVALGVFTSAQAEADAQAEEFRSTLDQQTGAITDNTRALVANQLEQKGFLALGAKYGITGEEMVNAILAGGTALDELRGKVERAAATQFTKDDWNDLVHLKAHLGTASADAQGFVTAQQRVGGAVGVTTEKVNTQVSALQTLAVELRKQSDPAFALIKAQQDLATAQGDYNEAVKEHGRNSPQAKEASLKLAEQAVVLAEAIAGAADTFDGKLTPAMRATLEAAGLTERQIKDVEAGFAAARKKGDEFAKDYVANVEADTRAAQAAVQALIVKVLSLKNKKIRIDADVYWTSSGDLHVGTGTQQRRWGGIDYHASAGGSIQAHHATAPTVLYGERATGGEAFIPRHGDFGRSMGILSTAASWYGMQVGRPAAMAGGGGGGGAQVIELHATFVYPDGKTQRQVLRSEAVSRGVPSSTIAAAYP